MISIIIPACNEENYIQSTINSIKSQNFIGCEIIVVCDGCTDKTINIAKNEADKFVLQNERKGPAVAKNEGVKLAKYNKLVFLDADTKLTENTLNSISEALDKKYFGTCRIKPDNNRLKHKIMMFFKNLYPFPFTNGIIFCSKESFLKVNGFADVKKGEDGDFVNKIKKENEFIILKTPVISSTRRFDKKGYLKVMLYWIKEKIKPSNEDYEIIR